MTNSAPGPSANGPPLVSAVVPTRGRPELVRRAVASALAQTWGNLEVVVVVDGQDDLTAKALAAIDDKRLYVVPLRQSVGGAEARNVGARQARGAWIALLDDDDEWLPEKIEAQMAAVAGLGSRNVLAASLYLHRAPGAPDVVRPRRLPKEGEPIVEYMFDHLCYFQTSTLLCSIDVIRRIPFQKGLALFQDIDWFLRANSDSRVRFRAVAEPLSIYYEPASRKTMTGNLGWRQRLEWGRARRHVLGRRGYARFVVGSCVGRAVEDRAGFSGLARLIGEAAFVGSATPKMLALLLGTFLLPPGLRRQLRDALFLKKRAYAGAGNSL